MKKIMLMLVSSFMMISTVKSDTIAWWHFDECDAGVIAPANTIKSDNDSTYANVYTADTPDLYENSGEYLPVYKRPFIGTEIYDPVLNTVRTNRSSMGFRSDSYNSIKAKRGGVLKFTGANSLYSPLLGKNTITVEAFVCTTANTVNVFAPIIGFMGENKWTSERFAIYLESGGTVAIRFEGNIYYTHSTGVGKTRVDDGQWHHVAFTYDGEYVRVYVDYTLDKHLDNTDRKYSKVSTFNSISSDSVTWIGGYNFINEGGGRKFNGMIDEIRVSDTCLTPDKFLRMRRIDTDPDEILRVSFTPNEYGILKNDNNLSDLIGIGYQPAIFKKVSTAGNSVYDLNITPFRIIANKSETFSYVENTSSFYQETNSAKKANYIYTPNIHSLILGDYNNKSYTVEFFYKTRNSVSGTENDRQVLAKFGRSYPYWNVIFNAISSSIMFVVQYGNNTSYLVSNKTKLDDGQWHHVAVVADNTHERISLYIDYILDKSVSGALPDLAFDPNDSSAHNDAIFFGANHAASAQFYDGWLDEIRIMRRALRPDEFLTTHPVGEGNLELLASFNENYDFILNKWGMTIPEKIMTFFGIRMSRPNGNLPILDNERYAEIFFHDFINATWYSNKKSVFLNKSILKFSDIPFLELDEYTVEFIAKFDKIIDIEGEAPVNSTTLSDHAPILRVVRNDYPGINEVEYDPLKYDWYMFRNKLHPTKIGFAIDSKYPAIEVGNYVVDGKWHHYAITHSPDVVGNSRSYIQLFYDYQMITNISVKSPGKCVKGHSLLIGVGSHDDPNLQMNFDIMRFSKGVLSPYQFLNKGDKNIYIKIK